MTFYSFWQYYLLLILIVNFFEVQASLAPKQLKDLRSLCLKIISSVLSKFDDHDFSVEFWDIFFSALKPLIDGFKQEGASSEKPSSLFVCFLAMSKSHKLVSQFQRANNLVPDIFSILTVPTASEAIISCVLRFIENLLNLDNEVRVMTLMLKEFYFLMSIRLSAACITFTQAKILAGMLFFCRSF
ncbi:putative down-regulated-in-metastasis protein [Helianthus annuus]|nr:putative down-regulated-in-metastasis protein [Helianthus annuus]